MGYSSDKMRAKAVELGLPSDWSPARDMAEYYVLERLKHDSASHAARFVRHCGEVAPRLALYAIAICGGELRHLPSQGYDDFWECYREHEGECGCHCYDCHYESLHEHDEECEGEAEYVECTCDEADEDDEDHYCEACEESAHTDTCRCYECTYDYVCGLDEECEGGSHEFWESDCVHEPPRTDIDDVNISAELRELITEAHDNGSRSEGWRYFVNYWRGLDRQDANAFVQEMANAFDQNYWEGGYGGENWQTVAQLTADYLSGKVKASTYIDRCWSLEHNGGNIFDKMFGYEETRHLMKLLIAQAKDEYSALVARCRTEVSRLWHQRNMFLRADFDDVWLGTQNIWYNDEEVA